MPNTRKMHGGVRLVSGFTDSKDALYFFLMNSTFRVLTNNSISCITLVVSLNPGVPSPYAVLRNNNFNARVDKILLKIFITANEPGWFEIDGRGPFYGLPQTPGGEPPVSYGIEVTGKDEFINEINIQRDVYRKSFLSEASFLEPMCPHIMNYHHCSQNGSTIQLFKSLNGLNTNEQEDLNKILEGENIKENQISYIAMEFMDGFKIASDIIYNPQYQDKLPFFYELIQYEFQRLNMYKYVHGDAHFGNVMIHPDYQYFYGGPIGRALIIDFGRTYKNDDIDPNIVDNDLERFRHENWGIPKGYLINIDGFNKIDEIKRNNMQLFFHELGDYLEKNKLKPDNTDRSYKTIRETFEQMINSKPEVYNMYNIGGALSKSKLFKTDYKVFKNNLIALFDDKANGELKGELYTPKKKNKGSRKKNIRRITKKRKKRKKRKPLPSRGKGKVRRKTVL